MIQSAKLDLDTLEGNGLEEMWKRHYILLSEIGTMKRNLKKLY